MSIGLSFGESASEDRPRSLTVQERLRADILSTRLLPGQKLHIAGPSSSRMIACERDLLAEHFSTTMRFVEQNAPKIAEVSGFRR
jgi:hypothetical protein